MASRMSDRLREAAKLGFKSAIIPKRLRSGGFDFPKRYPRNRSPLFKPGSKRSSGKKIRCLETNPHSW